MTSDERKRHVEVLRGLRAEMHARRTGPLLVIEDDAFDAAIAALDVPQTVDALKAACLDEARRVPWTRDEDAAIDTARAVDAIRALDGADEYLRRILFEVWAEAYATGWSDGQQDRDPVRDNPYAALRALPSEGVGRG